MGGVGALASSRGVLIEVARGVSGIRFERGLGFEWAEWVSGAGGWIPEGAEGFGCEDDGWGACTVCDRQSMGVVGVGARCACCLHHEGVGGSARGAFSLGVGAGIRTADVALVGGLCSSGDGDVGIGSGWEWGGSSWFGVELGARRWERAGVSR